MKEVQLCLSEAACILCEQHRKSVLIIAGGGGGLSGGAVDVALGLLGVTEGGGGPGNELVATL